MNEITRLLALSVIVECLLLYTLVTDRKGMSQSALLSLISAAAVVLGAIAFLGYLLVLEKRRARDIRNAQVETGSSTRAKGL